MIKAVLNLEPFDMVQKISLCDYYIDREDHKEANLLNVYETNLSNLTETLEKLILQQEVGEVIIFGNKNFVSQYTNPLLTKYEKNVIITIVEK